MRLRTSIPPVLVLLLLLVAPCAGAQDQRTELHQLFDDYWEAALEANPLSATAVGAHQYNHRLPEVTVAEFERRRAQQQAFLDRLHAIDPEELDPDDRINHAILDRQLQEAIRVAQFRAYYMPLRNWGDFHTSFPELGDRMPFRTVQDYENYIARLRGFRQYATSTSN